jgi:hypothetical protein
VSLTLISCVACSSSVGCVGVLGFGGVCGFVLVFVSVEG